jgi:hyaluronan synthase
MIRRIVPAYLGETFMGRPVKLGDDAALTLFAAGCGRAVQQSSSFAFTMYPETLSQHFRQWLRWMRGSTIRNCWRLRYLPAWSFGWWFTVIGYQAFGLSMALPVLVALDWPGSKSFTVAGAAAMLAWGYASALRIVAVRRSDEGWWFRAGTAACYPFAMVWAAFVLRPIRLWGIVTCLNPEWTTRRDGPEDLTAGGGR